MSFFLSAVPQTSINQYLASHPDYCEDDDETDTCIDPEEALDIDALTDLTTHSTSFEHDAELDMQVLSQMGFSSLFEPNIEDEEYGIYCVEDSQFYLKEFQAISSDEKFNELFDKYYDDEEHKAWLKVLINTRLIPFFEQNIKNNEGFITEWG